jgi:hypothetical protein
MNADKRRFGNPIFTGEPPGVTGRSAGFSPLQRDFSRCGEKQFCVSVSLSAEAA